MLKKKIKRKPLKTDFSFFFFFPLPLFCFVIFSPSRQVLATNLSKFLVAFFHLFNLFCFCFEPFQFLQIAIKNNKNKSFRTFLFTHHFFSICGPKNNENRAPVCNSIQHLPPSSLFTVNLLVFQLVAAVYSEEVNNK